MASVDELRALPWAQLIAEARTSACDDLHSALMKWMCAEGKLSTADAALWRLIEPVLGLYVELDPEAERPFQPMDRNPSTSGVREGVSQQQA
jgi:hypothetical protein